MKTKLLLILLSTLSLTLLGQGTILHPRSNQTVVLSPGTHRYTDDGGSNGNYSANIASTLTMRPAKGHFIFYSFREFETEKLGSLCADFLTINPFIFHCAYYNNPTEDYCGNYNDVLQIGTGAAVCDGRDIESTFVSDATIQQKGWVIDVEVLPKNLYQNFCAVESFCSFGGFPFDQVYCESEFSVPINRFAESACGGRIDIYEGCGNHYGGNEKVVEFFNDKTQDVTIKLSGIDLLAAFVVSDCRCLGSANANSGELSLALKALRAGTYLIIMEHGIGFDVSSIDGIIECGASNDGKLDCNAALPIECGQSVVGNTMNTKNKVEKYLTCQGALNMTGNEIIYNFTPSVTGDITLELTGLSANLDMFLLEACDANGNCLELSRSNGNAKEVIKFYAVANSEYYIVIDGNNKANSPFQLSVSCSSTECQSCGACFTYGLYSTASDKSRIKLYSKYNKCGDPNYPNGYEIEWYRQGILLTKGQQAEYVLSNNFAVNICQKVKKGSIVEFECCHTINPLNSHKQGPVAHYEVSEYTLSGIKCDAGGSKDYTTLFMDFGDRGTGMVTQNSPTFIQKYKDNGLYNVCVEAKNAFGMSRYCHSMAIGAIECGGPLLFPLFHYTLNDKGMISITATNADHIESYSISFGDGMKTEGGKWSGKVSHSYLYNDVFEILIQYKQSSMVGAFPCLNDGCLSFSVKFPTIVANENVHQEQVSVYPNPFQEEIQILYPDGAFELTMYDDLGRQVIQQSSDTQITQISTQNWNEGMYYYQLKSRKTLQIYTGKIIKN